MNCKFQISNSKLENVNLEFGIWNLECENSLTFLLQTVE